MKALREHWTRDNEEIYLAPRVTRAIEPEVRAPATGRSLQPSAISVQPDQDRRPLTPRSDPKAEDQRPKTPLPAPILALTPTPLHRKWWFWTAIGGGVATLTTVLVLVLSKKTIAPIALPEGF